MESHFYGTDRPVEYDLQTTAASDAPPFAGIGGAEMPLSPSPYRATDIQPEYAYEIADAVADAPQEVGPDELQSMAIVRHQWVSETVGLNSALCPVLVPPYQAEPVNEQFAVEIPTDVGSCLIEPRIYNRALLYSNDPWGSDWRRQDCVAFAYECSTGITLPAALQGAKKAHSEIVAEVHMYDAPPDKVLKSKAHYGQPIGTVVAVAHERFADAFLSGKQHFMVNAGMSDAGVPVYLSKGGIGGPVMLSTLDDMVKLYSARAVAVIRNLHYQPYEEQL